MAATLPRGARVMVRFEDHGPEHAPFEWTGTVLGPSSLPGRVRIRPDWVTWRGPIHLLPEGERGVSVTRIAKDAPVQYREYGTGRVHIAPFQPGADFYAMCSRIGQQARIQIVR